MSTPPSPSSHSSQEKATFRHNGCWLLTSNKWPCFHLPSREGCYADSNSPLQRDEVPAKLNIWMQETKAGDSGTGKLRVQMQLQGGSSPSNRHHARLLPTVWSPFLPTLCGGGGCVRGQKQGCSVDEASLPPLPPQYWDYEHAPPDPTVGKLHPALKGKPDLGLNSPSSGSQ